MKILHTFCLLLGFLAAASQAQAGTLYAATSAGGPGELCIIDQANGASVQDIGPLNDSIGTNYPITGLAFSPVTGVLYGSTGNAASVDARLVTINPATALVTVIGSFNAGPIKMSDGTPATMADLAFDAAGNLYGVGSIGGPNLYSINTSTGQATSVGSSGVSNTEGGGLAVNSSGVIYGNPNSSRFGTYNAGTGEYTQIANPARPVGGAYAALDFDGGTLYALNLGPGPTLATRLVTMNPATGAIIELGASITALDAIAFAVPEPGTIALMLVGVAVSLFCRPRR